MDTRIKIPAKKTRKPAPSGPRYCIAIDGLAASATFGSAVAPTFAQDRSTSATNSALEPDQRFAGPSLRYSSRAARGRDHQLSKCERTMLFDLDVAIQRLNTQRRDDPIAVQLTGVYHNLLRRWAEV